MLTPDDLSAYIPPGASIAIAFSGGGDSTALVHALRDYRPKPHIFIVDHNLRPGSSDEAQAAQDFALALGLPVDVLAWDHDNPASGIQAKARKARYGLMGEACRAAGIEYLLTGHTQDDQAETLLMRYERGTGWRGAAGMASSIYAPIWPEIAQVTLVRPLFGETRESLRAYNRAHDLTWTEDPSNQNRDFARIQARDHLQNARVLRADLLKTAQDLRQGLEEEKSYFRDFFGRYGRCDENGMIYVRKAPPMGLLEILLRAASGTGGPIDKASLKQLKVAMLTSRPHAGTLAGAIITHKKGEFAVTRDPVAAKGRTNQPAIFAATLEQGKPHIWDGRFVITVKREGLMVGPLLSRASVMKDFNPRKQDMTLPAVWHPLHPVTVFGHISDDPDVEILSLVASRLHNMLGGHPTQAFAAYK